MKYPILIVALLSASIVSAIAAGSTGPYEWDDNRMRYKLTEEEEKMGELMLRQHVEYNYKFEDDVLIMEFVLHRIILVNNSEAVQKHNRLKIPMSNTLALLDVRARTFTKDGRIILLDKDNLKEIKDEQSGNAYRIFAMEGVEVGSEIEYYFVRKMNYLIYSNTVVQMDVPLKKVSFSLTCPKHLKFDFRSYSGFPQVEMQDDTLVNRYYVEAENIAALEEEPLSYFDAIRKKVEFKFAYNTAKSQARLYTWDAAAKRYYGVLNSTEKDDEKSLESFVKTLKDDPNAPLTKRIRDIERHIKRTIQLNEESGDKSLSELKNIIRYKVASREGMTKLFCQVFRLLNIEINIVVTCSREVSKFDTEFDTWNYMDDYLLYFPKSKGFMAPYTLGTIYPLVPFHFTAQKGLFIEPLSLNGVNSGLGSIQEIPALPHDLTFDNLAIDVSFSNNMESNLIKQKRGFSGYSAAYITPYYHLMTEDQRKQMIEEMIDPVAPDHVMQKWEGSVSTDGTTDQFVMSVDFETTNFLEKAGPRILFKAGLLIGPQMEMYRDEKRSNDIENAFNRHYDRTIIVLIPPGYSIKNIDDLKFNVIYKDGDDEKFAFKSDYRLEGDRLTIVIDEFYEQIYVPVSRYEDFRKVINAAADFNKVTLVLEKK